MPYWAEWILLFTIYSLLGWICESTYCSILAKKFVNRGFLNGPFCPIYGVGALLFLLLFYRLIQGKPWKQRLLWLPLLFVGCMVSATLVELGASYLCQALTGSWPWQTYVNYRYHFQGRIALSPSIRFGLGGPVLSLCPSLKS